jgi:hypothetical protein
VSLVEELRANADERLDWARTAQTERERQIFLQMARAWLEEPAWAVSVTSSMAASG